MSKNDKVHEALKWLFNQEEWSIGYDETDRQTEESIEKNECRSPSNCIPQYEVSIFIYGDHAGTEVADNIPDALIAACEKAKEYRKIHE
jgi:hypothetical protein